MIIYGRDDEVARWYAERMQLPFVPEHMAVGLVNSEGYIEGALLLMVESQHSASLSIYSEAPSLAPWAKEGFQWMFSRFGRITVRTRKSNKLMIKHYQRMGFKFECVARDFYGPGEDGVQHFLTRDRCRWLNGQLKRTNLQRQPSWQEAEAGKQGCFPDQPASQPA